MHIFPHQNKVSRFPKPSRNATAGRLFRPGITLIIFLLSVAATAVAELEVRYITPPTIDEKHLGEHIVCHRPMRVGTPRMELEDIGNKVVVHNYGHGGSGWTLGPGCARYVVNELEQSTVVTYESPITIVGAGCIGLFTAVELCERGYKNITIIAESFDKLTSHNAGGLLAPVSMRNAPHMQALIEGVGIYAYQFYAAIANGTHSLFKQGAIIVPTYFDDREHSGLEPYVDKVMEPAKDVLLDFGNGTTRQMVVYDDGIFIDTAIMMCAMTDYLQSRVTFIHRKINNFAEINDRYIINCCGLGAQDLCHDHEMKSVQGHLIMLKNQDPAELQYMILSYGTTGVTKSGQTAKRAFYIFPKRFENTGVRDVGVIGGTFIEGATRATPNEEEFAIMIENAKVFYGL